MFNINVDVSICGVVINLSFVCNASAKICSPLDILCVELSREYCNTLQFGKVTNVLNETIYNE